ncbi:MAG: hypothetical protein LBJ00_07520 [Planctomycetaceae bacterium]|jgi:TrmH family RNA methyltransferase|nr:hypothetical protein [Planctomycetaceae bacterium]
METIITSFSNPKIKDVIKLHESNYRRDSRRFLIDGLREIERAALSGIQFLEFFILESKIDIARKLAPNNNVTINIVSELLIQKIRFGNRNDGIVAVALSGHGKNLRQLSDFQISATENQYNIADFSDINSSCFQIPETEHANIASRNGCSTTKPNTNNGFGIPLFVVLEKIEKPGNIGAVFRSADGAGVSGIILADQLTDLYNPNTIRASLGTLFSIPVVETAGLRAREWLLENNIRIATAKCGGEFSYTKYDFRQPTAIVLGSEAEGLTEIWSGEKITPITIPMSGVADSLNISTAAAILLYEAKRQRSHNNQNERQ